MTIVQISAKLFWGYQYYIPNTTFESMSQEEIIIEVKKDMQLFFKKHNLLDLYDRVKDLNLHIHSNERNDIGDEGDIIYLCDHCNY